MSLVSEALRKARAEAAEREGRRHGVPRALALPPKRWRSGPGLMLLAVIIIAAALIGAGAAWWALGRRPAAAGAEARGATQATPMPEVTTPNAAIAPEATVAPGPAPEPTLPHLTGQERAATSVAATPPPEAAGRKPPAPEPREPGADSRRAAPAEPSAPGRERSFALDADLGYAKLHLDYIVFRPGSPFAGINGGQVMVGSVIDGFSVEQIGAEFVRLRDRHGVVVLRIR